MLIKLDRIKSNYGEVNLARPIPVEVGYDPAANEYFAFNQLLDIFSSGSSRSEAIDGFKYGFLRNVERLAYEDPVGMSLDNRKFRANTLIYLDNNDEEIIEIDEENFFGDEEYWETEPIIEEYKRISCLIADTLQADMDAANCLSTEEWVKQDGTE